MLEKTGSIRKMSSNLKALSAVAGRMNTDDEKKKWRQAGCLSYVFIDLKPTIEWRRGW
jgi:hypothetical protein